MGNPSALIVEDDYDLSNIFAEALQAAGFETEVIRAGDVALEWLAVTAPDIVVLDLHLPGVAGPDILQYIRADPRLTKTPVIVATAHPHMAESLRKEANLVLIKPVSFSQLRDLSACFLRAMPSPNE
ncbi:MAG: response regulator [Anaerolineae bacterium]